MLATPRQDSARLRGCPRRAPLYVQTVDTVAARALSLATKDYAVDDDSTGSPHDAWDGLAQNVVLRLSTSKGRLPYAPTFGNVSSAWIACRWTHRYARKSAAEAPVT